MFGDLARTLLPVGPCHAEMAQRFSEGLADADARVE